MNRWAGIGWVVLGLLVNCGKSEKIPSSIGLLDRTATGEVKTLVVFPPVAETTYERGQVTTGFSPYLLLGEYDDYKAKFLLRFSGLPDSAVVESATLSLFPDTSYGDLSPFTLAVHQVDVEWTEDDVTWESFGDGTGGMEVGSATCTPGDTTAIAISIDTSLVHGWIDTTVVNNGLLVDCEGSYSIQEFHSRESLDADRYPQLELIYVRVGVRDTTVLISSADATLVQYEGTPPPNRLAITDGTGWRSIVRFDFAEVPKDATILRAQLEVTFDPAESRVREGGVGIGARPVSTESWEPSVVEVDSTVSVPYGTIVSDSEVLTFSAASEIADFTNIVQLWTSGVLPNYGLMLYSAVEGLDVSEAFFLGTAADSSLAPKVIIEYSIPPLPQF